ncbi:unnamed protein product, partial [Brachionus calyciflorus]
MEGRPREEGQLRR